MKAIGRSIGGGERRGWEDNLIFLSIQQGFVLAIPLLMVGSLALVIGSFPVDAYQQWLDEALGGVLRRLATMASAGTMDILSLVFILTISYSYGKNADGEHAVLYPAVALSAYVAFTFRADQGALTIFNVRWMFTALLTTFLSCALFRRLFGWRGNREKMYTSGADYTFNLVLRAIVPAGLVVLLFAGGNALMGDSHIQNWGAAIFVRLFTAVGRNFFGAILLVLAIHVLWFFGLHGSNMLETVTQNLFEGGMAVNQSLTAAGQAPTEIYTKSFLDTFVMMGGSGTCICLVIALLLVGRRQCDRRLAKIAAGPVLFNINELMVFGLPIVLNPSLLIPFLLVPLTATCTSSLAVAAGLVPVTVHTVQWTTPAIFSGYVATGSVAGSLLQIVNIALGVLIYIPFVRRLETKKQASLLDSIGRLEERVRQAEQTGEPPKLLEAPSRLAAVAKMLLADLRHDMRGGRIGVFYQPQMRLDGTPLGGEALLRWKHPVGGYIYPPLIVALAREDGLLDELELLLTERVCADMERMAQETPRPLEISLNITPSQLENETFVPAFRAIVAAHRFAPHRLGVEITEQVALSSNEAMDRRLDELRRMDVTLIMDDFGMGHSSMMYLQNQRFGFVKLDGKLTRSLMENERAAGIVSSIHKLSDTLDFEVIAEYVETPAQRERLAELGCVLYQGYLYSPALPLEEFLAYIGEHWKSN